MRQILTVLVVLIVAGLIAYNNSAGMRETFRSWRTSGDDAERLDAYAQGKALFLAAATSDPAPRCEAWGDDANEDAKPVFGNIWVAHGHFTSGSSTASMQWCVLFEINKGSPIICETGVNANAAIAMIGSGQYQAAISRFSPNDPHAARATPRPGSWMWDKTSPLEQPAKRDGS